MAHDNGAYQLENIMRSMPIGREKSKCVVFRSFVRSWLY